MQSRLGSYEALFDGLTYPANEYFTPEDFFLNEDEWTTHENFEQIFRKAKMLLDEPDFFFRCGASTARLRSWGRLHYFARVFGSPNEGFRRLPFFNKTFTDTKEIELILPPTYDRSLKKIRVLLKIQFRSDFDPHKDYIGDPFTQGILSSIPTIWGLPPASISQSLNPYNPVILLNEEPEFIPFGLEAKIEGRSLTLRDPARGERIAVGEKIYLVPEDVNGREVFLGRYERYEQDAHRAAAVKTEAILITKGIITDDRIILRKGQIFMAPYAVLDVTYERLSFFRRLSQLSKTRDTPRDSESELIKKINQLNRSMRAKNEAYLYLERANEELKLAKAKLDEYSRELEQKVEERTAELRKAQQDLLRLNRDLESKVESQVMQLEKYNELRRYLSPQLTEKILSGEHDFGTEPKRKLMTVVFTDIRGFSRVTDNLEPEELFQLLNRYLSEMIKVVHHYDGTLNKIVGDGLLIFFGDPIPMEDHAERAVRMAIHMQEKVRELKEQWLQYDLELEVGIGINTGFVTIGNIGSDRHRDHTVIGNQVNVAARLESEAKAGQILISQRTYSRVKGTLEVEEVGEITVKGISYPVKTYSVIWS
ncbi:MAG: adenylate/guanylate cyclase domain-containing protein [Pseudomonadota bacterium]